MRCFLPSGSDELISRLEVSVGCGRSGESGEEITIPFLEGHMFDAESVSPTFEASDLDLECLAESEVASMGVASPRENFAEKKPREKPLGGSPTPHARNGGKGGTIKAERMQPGFG